MTRGSQPTDGGNLLLSDEERSKVLEREPNLETWIKPFLMGDDFINNGKRFCFWLENCSPEIMRSSTEISKRLAAIKATREQSTKESTRNWAKRPNCFTETRQPETNYLAIPRVSSERRDYIPIGYMEPNQIAGDKLQIVPDASIYHFGTLTSCMHMAWTRTVCGRLKSDYSYSNTIVYNNFPWPQNPTDKQKANVEAKAQAVLDARAKYPDSSLADLYDPLTMPPELVKAHEQLTAPLTAQADKPKQTRKKKTDDGE
jgi:hypothetical protein